MYGRTKCCCIPDARWSDRTKLDDYLRGCSAKAREVKEKYADQPEKLVSGLTCLLDLKKLGYDNVDVARGVIQENIPFKFDTCMNLVSCCGFCVRRCKKRCVQDILHKLYMKAIPVYLGQTTGDTIAREACKALLSPTVTYDTLNNIVNYAFTRAGSTTIDKMEDIDDTVSFRYNYAPQTLCTPDKLGRLHKEFNPETGEIYIIKWPESGLCPYCVPQITYTQKRGRKPKNRTDDMR